MGSVVIIKYSLPLRSFHSVGPGIKTMTRDGVRPPEERETILWACEGGFESISQDGLYSGRRVLRDISYILEKKKATGHNNFIPPIPPTPPQVCQTTCICTHCLPVCLWSSPCAHSPEYLPSIFLQICTSTCLFDISTHVPNGPSKSKD